MRTIKRIVLLLCSISIILTFKDLFEYGDNYLLPLIPLFFAINYKFVIPNNIVIGSGFFMLTVVEVMRYIFYPILYKYDEIGMHNYEYFDLAVLLTIVEMFVIHFVIRWYYSKHKEGMSEKRIITQKMSFAIPIVCVFFMLATFIAYPSIFGNRNFIFNTENINNEIIKITGILSQPMKWAEVFLIIYFFYVFNKAYQRSKSMFSYYLSIIVVLIPCLFFSGHSRLSLLMPLIGAIFILQKVYADKAKQIIYLICSYGFVAISLLSLQKFFGDATMQTASESLSLNANASLLNAYFGGLKNMMVGLRAYEALGSSFSIFINDICRNMMGVSTYFVDNPRNSVTIFNTYFYNSSSLISEDQICPTVIEGLLIFGPIFSIIPTIIMVYIICVLDYKWRESKSLGYSYLYSYIGTLIGWAVPGNFMHLTATMFNLFIPIILLLNLNKKISNLNNC